MSRKSSYMRLSGLTAALVAAGLIASPLAFAMPKVTVAGALQSSNDLSVSSRGQTDPNHTTINGESMRGATGSIAVNAVSGSDNAQANATVVNNGTNGGLFAIDGSLVSQSIDDLLYNQDDSTNSTNIGNDALRGASGQISVNAAAGDANQQANVTAVSRNSMAMLALQGALTEQSLTDSGQSWVWSDGTNTASLNGHALQDAGGQISVSLVSGQGNQQSNATAISRGASYASLSVALVDQDSFFNGPGDFLGFSGLSGRNSASVSGNALQGASGEIGVNAAAGQMNQQANDVVVNSAPGAGALGVSLVFQNNMLTNWMADDHSDNTASLGGSALSGASGQISVNVAAGHLNQQANATSVTRTNADFVFAGGAASVQGQGVVWNDNDGSNAANMTGSALSGASGDIGVNVAAGANNEQANGVQVVSAASLSGVAGSGAVQYQFCDSARSSGSNSVALGGNTLQNASGNIGVNMAAGSGNLQSNVMTIATSTGVVGGSSGE